MELGGEAKRIQALFCDLRLEDQSLVPNFASLWNRAQGSALEPRLRYPFLRPLVVISLAAMITALTVTTWFRNSLVQQSINNVSALVSASSPPGWMPSIATPHATGSSKTVRPSRRVYRRTARKPLRVDVTDVRIQEAVAISSWQSPTAQFMQSLPSSISMTTPQLNQPVRELRLFLSQEQSKELIQ